MSVRMDSTELPARDGPAKVARRVSGSASTARVSRKRTKTGCLTCRRRRIKCGEEKPICNNCIKSKRHCDGYNQRVIFKPPTINAEHMGHGGFPVNLGLPMPFHGAALIQANVSSMQAFKHNQLGPTIAPWDGTSYHPAHPPQYNGQQIETPRPGNPSAHFNDSVGQTHEERELPQYKFTTGPYVSPIPSSFVQSRPVANTTVSLQPRQFHPSPDLYSSISRNHHATSANEKRAPFVGVNERGWQTSVPEPHGWPESSGKSLVENYAPPPEPIAPYQHQTNSVHTTHALLPPLDKASRLSSEQYALPPIDSRHSGSRMSNYIRRDVDPYQHAQAPKGFDIRSELLTSQPIAAEAGHASPYPRPQRTSPFKQVLGSEHLSPTQLLEEAAIEYEDDDYFDVDSEEDADLGSTEPSVSTHEGQRDLGLMLALHRASVDDMSIRRYDTYLDAGVLDTYRAERVANPLRNPQTARVFAHFIAATGPSLSAFERHPRNTSAIFNEPPVPRAQQSLWTYKLPMMALHHQGLLHAMLAISSLHMAKLSGASVTPSLKHYAYSLKRVHRWVVQPQKRHQVATLAATLLLGFYEVFSAEHIKWSTHLHGAKQLIVEIDYAGMAAEIKAMKLRGPYERGRHSNGFYDTAARQDMVMHPMSTSFVDEISNIDERFVAVLTGRKLRRDHSGRVVDDDLPQRPKSNFDLADLRNFAIYQDLYWWYCKQDIIQCLVSGNRLLVDYSQFANCPPRALVGKSDAVYGSSDHLSLLLARIGDFAAKDRSRKIRAVAAAGGTWRPPASVASGTPLGGPPPQGPATRMAPPDPLPGTHSEPSRMPPSQQSVASIAMQPPPFYGMAPAPPHRHMPSAFVPDYPSTSSSSPKSQEVDLATATSEAEDEWNQIRAAVTVFCESLGPDFQPLPAEIDQPLTTPFGHAQHYRSYDISCLWLWYYVGLIVCVRAHPSMPPAMNMAAGVAARQTAEYAMEIGRIAAGLGPTSNLSTVSPSIGAALIESCVALFCAGVQYQEMNQRMWALSRLRDIEATTGWATAGVIANGLESGWEKAAAAGRGPPYARVRDLGSSDERVSGQSAGLPAQEPRDRRFVHFNPKSRVYWAIGVLGEQEDLTKDIDDLSLH